MLPILFAHGMSWILLVLLFAHGIVVSIGWYFTGTRMLLLLIIAHDILVSFGWYFTGTLVLFVVLGVGLVFIEISGIWARYWWPMLDAAGVLLQKLI